jgi:predicted PurR-regulated permease PerM
VTLPDLVTPAPTTTRSTRITLIALALLAVAALVWVVADVWVIAFGGIVFATVIRALVVPLSRVTGWSQRVSLVVAILVLLGGFAVLCWLFGRQAAHQFAEMRQQLPDAAEKFQAWLAQSRLGRVAVDGLKAASQEGSPLANAGAALGMTVGGIGNLLLIVFVGIYLAADPGLYRDGALRLLPPSRRPQVGQALDRSGKALHQWLIAQLIVMVAVGVMTGGGLALLGVPLSLSLGLLAGLLEFVPVIGPIVSAVPGLLLAFTQGPQTAVYALILYVAVQQIESYVLTPLIQRWAVELPPVVALLSIVAGGLLFGVLGVIFATPMAVVVMTLVKHLYVEDTLEAGAGIPERPTERRARRKPSED